MVLYNDQIIMFCSVGLGWVFYVWLIDLFEYTL